MQITRLILREIVGMFVDDQFLALAVLAVVAAAMIAAFGFHAAQLWTGTMLVAGCLAVLASSVFRGSRQA